MTPLKNKKEKPVAAMPLEAKRVKAIARYIRISPRKLRLVLNSVRRKPAYQAMEILNTLPQKGARLAAKVLKSAIANAKVSGLDATRLFVADFRADCGPSFKRFLPRSMGRADRILKRTSHISVTLSEGGRFYTDAREQKALAAVAEQSKTASPSKARSSSKPKTVKK